MALKFREVDGTYSVKLPDRETIKVNFGFLFDGTTPPAGETPVIMLELYGVQFPLRHDEARAVASGLLAKANEQEQFLQSRGCDD